MKTKKFYHWMLTAALVCGLGMGVASCSKDSYEDDEKADSRIVTEDGKTGMPEELLTDEERYQMACLSAVIGTLRNLAGLESVTPDVVNENHEPTYGQTLDGESAMVRVVKSYSTEEAEQSFRAIAGLDSLGADLLLMPTSDGYALSLKDLPILKDGKTFTLGTLTFHRDGGPRRYGYVEVAIPCIPHLDRIDFLSPEAFPDNAGTNCPYQIGDIVYVPSSTSYCPGYYVCVANNGYRSTLCHMIRGVNPGGKESINLDNDKQGCWYPYNNSKGQKTTYDDITDYVSFILNNQAKVENIKAFLDGDLEEKQPLASGMMSHIFPEGFNNSRGVAFYNSGGSSAYVYYNAYFGEYYWIYGWIASGWDYRYAEYGQVPSGCSSVGQVSSGNKKYVYDKDWNNWVGYWEYTMNVIHTSSTVNGAMLDYSPVNDQVVHKNDAVNVSSRHLGWCYADNDRLYEKPWDAVNAGHKPLGVVVYVNDGSDFGNAVTEKDNGAGHALVMSYSAENRTSTGASNVRWNPGSGGIVSLDPDDAFTQWVNRGTGAAAALSDFRGYEKTAYLADAGSPAAQYCIDHSPQASNLSPTGWFIPSAAQWIAIMCKPGLGGAPMPSTSAGFPTYLESGSTSAFSNINTCISRAPSYIPFLAWHEYWSSSAYASSIGVYLTGTNSATRLTFWNANNTSFVRPVFAF